MDPETQARWNEWAKRIAHTETKRAIKMILDTTLEGLFKVTDPLAARIMALETELKALKERQPEQAEECPSAK